MPTMGSPVCLSIATPEIFPVVPASKKLVRKNNSIVTCNKCLNILILPSTHSDKFEIKVAGALN